MFDFLVNGARVLTVDHVADAVWEYARVLTEHGQTATVTFPAIVDGERGEARMSVGHGLPLVGVKSDPALAITLTGTEFAEWDIRRRIAEIDEPVDTDALP